MKRDSCGFRVADGVCSVCYFKNFKHRPGCRRATPPEKIVEIINRLPDLPKDSVGEPTH